MIKIKKLNQVIIALALSVSVSLTAHAKVDFAGKTVKLIVPFSSTGGTARWANFFAPLLSEHLPGKPQVEVEFKPGGGSTKGANWFQRRKHKDGTLIFASSASTQFPYMLDHPRVRYEYKEWVPVMATGTGGIAYLNKKDGTDFIASPNNVAGRNFVYGSQGAARIDLVALLAWDMLGMNVEAIFGIKGRGDGFKMFKNGKANIDFQTSSSYLKSVAPLIKEGNGVAMMSWGTVVDGNIERDPNFPNMRTFQEVCNAQTSCKTSGLKWDAWESFFVAGFSSQKMIFLPKKTPGEFKEAYVKAFEDIRARDDFASISVKQIGKYPMFVGKEAEKQFEKIVSVSDEQKKFLKEWLIGKYGVKFE